MKELSWADKTKHYNFHNYQGHKTSEWINLKYVILDLINKGRLVRYTKEDNQIYDNKRHGDSTWNAICWSESPCKKCSPHQCNTPLRKKIEEIEGTSKREI